MYCRCAGLRDDNLTMTRESWHQGTYSHQWGTSPVLGVVWGLMGVRQTSPGFASFSVRPKLGALAHASLTLPTLRGYINVSVSAAGRLEVGVPCNTVATLCTPRASGDASACTPTPRSHLLRLDGEEVAAVPSGGHLCAAAPVGCGVGGAPRVLSLHPR